MKIERTGSIAYMIVIFLAILAIIPVTMRFLTISRQSTQSQINQVVQAQNVARAGLTEAISWFRRQTTQPVRSQSDPVLYPYPDAAFYPRTTGNPLTSDTLDETIGLVKEFQLSETKELWARYEVKRQPDPATNPNDPHAVHDITDKRIEGGTAGGGLAWYLESVGYVFRRRNAAVAYNQTPNEIVGRSRVATEIRRLALTLPANAAVIVNNRVTVNLSNQSRIIGGNNIGLAYYSGGSGPTVSANSRLTGTPNIFDIDGAASFGTIVMQQIFGLSENELKLMSDIALNSLTELADEYPSLAVVYISGNATFDATHQLRGGGILYVTGNLTAETTSLTLFSGCIYVKGNCTIKGDALISGVLIVQGSLTMNGSGGVPEVDYDDDILNSVRQQVAQYRENKAMYYVFSALKQ